jgi:alkylhydroperoxidase family enzyme
MYLPGRGDGVSPRIDPVEPPDDEEIETDFDALMPNGMDPLMLFRTVAHDRRVLHRMRASRLLDEGAIEMREREILILRTCANCDCEYEWGVHVTGFSAAAGLTDDQITATVQEIMTTPVWWATDALLVRLADELHTTARVSDGLWADLTAHWEPAQLIEFVMVIGLYHAVSFTATAFEVKLEPVAEQFPGDETTT